MSQRGRAIGPDKMKSHNHADCNHNYGCSQIRAAKFGPICQAAFIIKCPLEKTSVHVSGMKNNKVQSDGSSHII